MLKKPRQNFASIYFRGFAKKPAKSTKINPLRIEEKKNTPTFLIHTSNSLNLYG